MKNIYYWCPFIGNVATINAVINSAHSLKKFSNKKFIPTIINSCGEWDEFNLDLEKKGINLKEFKNFFKLNTKVNGFLKSRITYIKIFFSCFFKLKNTLKTDNPDYIIVHLITSLPIFLYLLFNFKTKLIIRISGKVKMNFLRRSLWKLTSKKIFLISCPTHESKNELIRLNILDKSKIIFLPDPIIEIDKIISKKKEKIIKLNENDKFFVSIGRFTKQKNHKLLIKCFKNISKNHKDIKLAIIGRGELKNEYVNLINKLELDQKIYLINYENNIFNYLKKSIGLISTSLWEDPGFVMIEAAASNTFVISSDCPSGPKEFLEPDAGLLFQNDNLKNLEEKITKYLNMSEEQIKKFKTKAKKNCIKFTKFRHYKILSAHLI